MTAFVPQNILRCDRDKRTENIWPQCRRTHQDADADTADICAGEMGPLIREDTSQGKFGENGGRDREKRLLIAFQHAV